MTEVWYEEEAKRLEEENKARLAEQGYKEAIRLEQGVNDLVIDTGKKPEQVDTKNGKKWVFNLKEPEDRCLMASDYLYELVVKVLAQEKGAGAVQIVRTGEGTDTRYVVSPPKKK